MVSITISLDDKTYETLRNEVDSEQSENLSQAARKLIKCGVAWRKQLAAEKQ